MTENQEAEMLPVSEEECRSAGRAKQVSLALLSAAKNKWYFRELLQMLNLALPLVSPIAIPARTLQPSPSYLMDLPILFLLVFHECPPADTSVLFTALCGTLWLFR